MPSLCSEPPVSSRARHLVLVLGDQLDARSAAFDDFDSRHDQVLMAEVASESTHVWSSKPRTALFLSAMRHFAAGLRGQGIPVRYLQLGESQALGIRSLGEALRHVQLETGAGMLVCVQPGDWRVRQELMTTCKELGLALELREDRHFLCSASDFEAFTRGRTRLVMEFFYRAMRRKHRYLMEGDEPAGGRWNFDTDNRKSFGKKGPGALPRPVQFEPDDITREVFAQVEEHFEGHPGSLESFAWPVTREQVLQALEDFIEHRLPEFGTYEDAMWTDEPWLYHSRLSAALNLKLLNPREVLEAAEHAWHRGHAPLAAVEGFVRQILGWREYVRGLYWQAMPALLQANALEANEPLPAFFWTGRTEMACLRQALGQTLEHGYAHHIQRLMVIGLYAQLLGVSPVQVHEWFLAVYVDAVEWVEAPNVLGMSQFADGGRLATKPYVASGKYIDSMSNYCSQCPYNPRRATGADACPFTTLYWDFLLRHEPRFADNPRMALQLANARRLPAEERRVIRLQAAEHRKTVRAEPPAQLPLSRQEPLFGSQD